MSFRNISIKRIASAVANIQGLKAPKRYKDKPSALKALGRVSKQNFVLALAQTSGVTVEEIRAMYSISQSYARDIIAKLAQRGFSMTRDGDDQWTA